MTCTKTVFSPVGPCCGGEEFCKAWPKIDWNRTTWLVRTPDAELLQQETGTQKRSGLLNPNTWNSVSYVLHGPGAHPSEAEVGTAYEVPGPDVEFGVGAFWFRGDEYIAYHNGSCVWQVQNREELLAQNIAILGVTKTFPEGSGALFNPASWYMASEFVLTPEQLAVWHSRQFRVPEVVSVFEGFPYYGGGGEVYDNDQYVSLRDVITALACVWLPALEARDDISNFISPAEQNGRMYQPLDLINAFRNRDSEDWPNNSTLYKPTALDIAASAALTPGFLFGFVTDSRSPMYGEFTCFEGGIYEDGGEGVDAADPVLQSTPWELTSGDSMTAEFEFVNRFERTTDDESLPEWIELELIRI